MIETYDFVHLSLVALGGEVEGKTKLQKLIYFIAVLNNCAGDIGYRPHYYGPYSSEVADAIDLMLAQRFVTQSRVGGISVDAFGFEKSRTDYRLTQDGKEIGKKLAARL